MIEPNLLPRHQPFVYLTAALGLGIVTDRWIEPAPRVISVMVFLSILLSIKFVLSRKGGGATFVLLIGFASVGALLSLAERASVDDARLTRLYDAGRINPDDPVELTGRLRLPPEPLPGALYLDVDAESLRVRGRVIPAKGCARLLLAITDSEAASEFAGLGLDIGSPIRVLVRLTRARQYNNPGSPDFNEFLERGGYDLKGTIKSPLLIERAGKGEANRALAAIYHARLNLMSAIDNQFSPAVAGTLKAMLMGNRYFLDQQAMARLRQGAVFHVLAISGMHIGIIAWVLLGRGTRRRRRRGARLIFSLSGLWVYALMVGLAPPVTRATVMITIGLIGPILFRRVASINTVALAAFLMLSLKPALVADPGFQLSFIAVAAVVALALPLAGKLRAVGEWRPSARTPHPPACSRAVRFLAESLFWNERDFNQQMRRSHVRFYLDKSQTACLLNRARVQPVLRGVALLVMTSTAIQLSTLPLMILYFNRVAPIGILLNIISGLLVAVLMLTSLAALAAGAIHYGWLSGAWVAAKLGSVVTAAHYLLVNAIVPFADLPFATFRVPHYEGRQQIIYAVYFAPLVLLSILIDRWQPVELKGAGKQTAGRASRNYFADQAGAGKSVRPDPLFLCGVALLVCGVAVMRPLADPANGRLTIYFLDVGQGDSALVVFPRGSTMLIDAGGEPDFNHRNKGDPDDGGETESEFKTGAFSIGEAIVSRFLWSLGLTRIDYIVATHADADHIEGFSDVIENFQIGQATVGRVPARDAEYNRFARAVSHHAIPMTVVKAGESFELEGVRIEVLWPKDEASSVATSGNNDSIVLRLIYGSVSLLLTGDIERPTEEVLIQSGCDLQADLLKVAHHGSRTSSSEAFLGRVRPRLAVISVGERSRFGHPHPDVVSRFAERGIRLLQTGRDGMICAQTDGATLSINTYRAAGR